MLIITLIILVVTFVSTKVSSVMTRGSLIALNMLQVFLLTLIFNFGAKFIDLTSSLLSLKYELVVISIITALLVGYINLPTYKKFKMR